MLEAIKYNLSNLTNFHGRDARATFWWYVLFLVVAQFVVGMIASLPLVISTMGSAYDAAQSGVDAAQMEAQMMAGMADSIGTSMWISAFTAIATALLLLASFVRRLHDAGFSGYLAAIPMITQATSFWASIDSIDAVKELMRSAGSAVELQQMQSEITLSWVNYVGWAGFLVVIGFGIIKSQDGANQYGEEPRG